MLWLSAMLLFFIPLALIVAHLNRLMPLEGGLSEWARLAFNDQIGFLVAWNLWLFIMLYVAVIGLVTSTFLAYAVPSLAWMADNKWAVLAASVALIAAQMLLAGIGFGVGKWFNNAGSIAVLITVGVLVALPLANLRHGSMTAFHPLRLVAPPLTVFTLSVFSKMTFGALSGFEYVAASRGIAESRAKYWMVHSDHSARHRADLYLRDQRDSGVCFTVIGPIPQALRLGFGSFGAAIVPIAIFALPGKLSIRSVSISAEARGCPWLQAGTICCRHGSHACTLVTRHPSIQFFSWEARRSPPASQL